MLYGILGIFSSLVLTQMTFMLADRSRVAAVNQAERVEAETFCEQFVDGFIQMARDKRTEQFNAQTSKATVVTPACVDDLPVTVSVPSSIRL